MPTFIVFCGSGLFRVIWILTVFKHYQTIESIFMLYIFSYLITGVLETIYFVFVYRKAFRNDETYS